MKRARIRRMLKKRNVLDVILALPAPDLDKLEGQAVTATVDEKGRFSIVSANDRGKVVRDPRLS